MEGERDSADTPRSPGSDSNGSCNGFKLSAKLRARIKKLEKWRFHPFSIRFPKGAHEFQGGHAPVSKACPSYDENGGYDARSSGSGDRVRNATDRRRSDKMELDDKGKDDEEEHWSDSDDLGWGEVVAIKKSRIGYNKDLEQVLGLALRETEFLVELDHKDIVELKGFVEDLFKDIIRLVFLWADNGNLMDLLASRDWEIPERVSLISDVIQGLKYLHSQEPRICFGDLKSLDVSIPKFELRAAVADFGSARWLTQHDLNRGNGQKEQVQNQPPPFQASYCASSKTITPTGNKCIFCRDRPGLLVGDQMIPFDLGDVQALSWKAWEAATGGRDALPSVGETLWRQTETSDWEGIAGALWGLAKVHWLRDAIAPLSQTPKICTDIGPWKHDPNEQMEQVQSQEHRTSGSRDGYTLGAKLRRRLSKLLAWRIIPSSIKAPKDAREFHGGHAAVSKAFLLDKNSWSKSYNAREVLQLCRQSPESDDHIRGSGDDRQDAEEELGDEEKGDEEEHGSDSDSLWQGEFVAVKKSRIADNKDIERVLGLALRETEFLVELEHRNIVELKGFVEDLSKDIIWLVFPWAQNGNLKEFVDSQDWEIPERVSLINDVAKGLEYLHSQEAPICHGDLKSANVLVNSEHRAVITDFGSARRLTQHDLNRGNGQKEQVQNQPPPFQASFCASSNTITLTGNKYTLRWAAPELLNDDLISFWSDIWAFGWIAYEVMTDSIPFQDVPADSIVVERVIKGDLPSITEHARMTLLRELCSLMAMCWNSNPSKRPTAEYCRRAIDWMPKILPTRGPDTKTSTIRSPELLMQLGYMYQWQDDYVNAHTSFTEALRMHTDIGDRKGRASALHRLADVHRLRGEYSEAIALYSEALKIRTDISDKRGRADTLWGLAEVHRFRNEYSEAIALYSEVLQFSTEISNERGRSDALWGLAEVHRLRDEYSEAIALYSEVLQICTEVGDRHGRAEALGGLAEVHRLRKEYTEAIALYSEELQIRTDIGDRQGRADALWGLAGVHRLRNEYTEAIELYSQSLQICTDIDDKEGRADALEALADVHRHQNHYDDATSLYEQAAEVSEQSGNPDAAAYALEKASDARHRLKLVEAARGLS